MKLWLKKRKNKLTVFSGRRQPFSNIIIIGPHFFNGAM